MYSVDGLDEVVEIHSVPQSSIGAPIPAMIATENQTSLAFYLEDTPENWDGISVKVIDATLSGEPIAIVEFDSCYAHMFGPPNDEGFHGHPLESRGLKPYAVFLIKHSSWLRNLEKMNSVHPSHSTEEFGPYNHYVFAFHDSTFECIAKGFEAMITHGSITSALLNVVKTIR